MHANERGGNARASIWLRSSKLLHYASAYCDRLCAWRASRSRKGEGGPLRRVGADRRQPVVKTAHFQDAFTILGGPYPRPWHGEGGNRDGVGEARLFCFFSGGKLPNDHTRLRGAGQNFLLVVGKRGDAGGWGAGRKTSVARGNRWPKVGGEATIRRREETV